MNLKDTLFAKPIKKIEPFQFDKKVALVFDDMIRRSTPAYELMQELLTQLTIKYYIKGSQVYDLGCATGETLLRIAKASKEVNGLVGIDESDAMIFQAAEKCRKYKQISFIKSTVEDTVFSTASVFILSYFLQFIPVHDRRTLLSKLKEKLVKNGILLLSEKIISPEVEDVFVDLHLEFKRKNNYSLIEIQQKKEALENYLVPLTCEENIKLLRDVGFKTIYPFFQYLNFVGLIAINDRG